MIVGTRQKFSGRELDQDGIAYDVNNNQLTNGIGLNCFGARYYDPEIGSWTSTDPADEFWNSYSYVGGDPINFTDPSGMISIPAKPVSMFTSGIGRFAGTASIAGAFDHFTPVGSVDGLHFLNGMIRGKSDTTFYMGDAYVHGYREILDNDEEKEKEKGKGSSPGEDSPDKDNERNKWYWRDWVDLRENIGPPENPMNDIRLRNSQLILSKQNLNVRDAVKIEDPVASSGGTTGNFLQSMYNTLEGSLLDYRSGRGNSSFSLLLNNRPQGPFDVGSFPKNIMGRNVNFDVGVGLAAETKLNVMVDWKTMTVNATPEPGILFGVSKWGVPLPAAGTINSFSFSPSTGLRINYNSSLIGSGSINLMR